MTSTRTVCLLAAAAAACLLVPPSSAWTGHIVGGSYGWKTPRKASFYQDWAQGQKFVVGDKLVFLHSPGMETVMEVSKEDFEKCRMEVVKKMYHNGPTIVSLTEPGWHYYYSSVGLHCEAGLKISVNVASAGTEPVLN